MSQSSPSNTEMCSQFVNDGPVQLTNSQQISVQAVAA